MTADAIERALLAAKAVTDKPTLICCKTTIGMGAPNKQGSHDCHGAPLGKDEIAAARAYIGWNTRPSKSRRRLCRLERQAARRHLRRKLEPRFAAYQPPSRPKPPSSSAAS
jgi:transketolase